jgi:RNA polymerase sigma-70 factor, ECF subfamily
VFNSDAPIVCQGIPARQRPRDLRILAGSNGQAFSRSRCGVTIIPRGSDSLDTSFLSTTRSKFQPICHQDLEGRHGIPELDPSRVRPMDEMTRHSDDRELILACRAGKSEAFGLLITRYQGRLFPTVLRLVGSVEDAEDVLQDAFVRAYEKLDQFQGDSSFYTWIYRIAVNLALSGHRKRRVRSLLRAIHHRIDDGGGHPVDASLESDPSYALERAEREKLVQDALNHLGAEHRAVVVLKDFDGRRYEEISSILNVPIGTVRSRLHRARWELRERLKSLITDEHLVREPSPRGH